MVLTQSEYQSLRVHIQDLKETLQGLERQMDGLAKARALDGNTDAGLVFALAATMGTFNDRLEELEEKLGV